jgi:hypothetical protein
VSHQPEAGQHEPQRHQQGHQGIRVSER